MAAASSTGNPPDVQQAGCTTDPEKPENEAPLLTQYDTYHQAVYCLDTPIKLQVTHLKDKQQQQTSSAVTTPTIPDYKINYQDFAAEITGFLDGNLRCDQNFQNMVERANCWLKQNPGSEVRTCETLTRTTPNTFQVGDTESVVSERCTCPSLDVDTYYHMGLRCWVVPSQQNPQRLGYRDYKARDREKLSALIKRTNASLVEEPIQGRIITIETILVPHYPSWDTNRVFWRDSQCRHGNYSIFIRVVYTEGPPCYEMIGIQSVVPERGNEAFSVLMRQASAWIGEHPEYRLTNIRSAYVCKQSGETAKESSDCCVHRYYDFEAQHHIQVLRVFYVQDPRISATNTRRHLINCMTFTPVQTTLGPNSTAAFEKMKQTMIRILAWINLADANVYSTESFTTPVIPKVPNHQLPEVTSWTPNTSLVQSDTARTSRFLTHIRFYIDGEFREPDSRLLPALPYSLTLALQASIQQREITRRTKRKKQRRRRRRIIIIVAFSLLVVAGAIILLEQTLGLFHF